MHNHSFTAIDFETAQGPRWSICQVGLVRVEQGQRIRELSVLVRPPDNRYHYYNTAVHGLRSEDTWSAPVFSSVWPSIEPYIRGQIVVAHNGAFDFSCLQQTLEFYNLTCPDYSSACTYKIYRRKLDELCAEFNIDLNHHDALSDARACATLYERHLMQNGVAVEG